MANPLASIMAALGGKPKASSMSIGGKPSSTVKDILSRPSRPRRKGYKKTELKPAGRPAKAGAMPDLGETLAMPPLGGGPGSIPQ